MLAYINKEVCTMWEPIPDPNTTTDHIITDLCSLLRLKAG